MTSEVTRAVFLSYASQDAEAARRVCEALRAAGIEVWFDQSELRGGDAWEHEIRRQIRDCALFIAVISANTQERPEGYFRLEWKLAVDRSHLMAVEKAFLVPVTMDATDAEEALVPERFRELQWIYLPRGEPTREFVDRIARLLNQSVAARHGAAVRDARSGHGAPAAMGPPAAMGAPEAGVSPLANEPQGASTAGTPLAGPAEAGPAEIPFPGIERRRSRTAVRWWPAVGVGVLLVAGAALWIWAERSHAWHSPLASARFSRLTEFSGSEEQAASISRDGRMAAFLAERDGHPDAWLTDIGSGTYRNLTQGSGLDLINPLIRTLGFSADGSLVTIWTRRSDGSRTGDISLMAAPTAGGALRPFLREASEVAWSSDGKRIVYHTTSPGDPLFVKEVQQQEATRIYTAPAGVHCHFLVWSPDDAYIYFARGVPPDAWDVWRIRPSGSDPERITFQNSRVSHPVLLDRRTLMYLASDPDGSGPWLYALDVEERTPHRLSAGLERYTSLAASADGQRLVATVTNPRTSLWSVSLTAGGIEKTAVPISSDSATSLSPRIGPNYLLYLSWRGARQSIWKLASGRASELWSDPHTTIIGAPAIAPDGRRIAFSVANGGKTLLYVMDSDGSHSRVVAEALALKGNPAWAPDGQSIVSAVTSEGVPRLATISLNGNSPITLVADYSIDPVWSPDGQFMLYSGADVGTTFPLRAISGDGRPYGLATLILTRGARRVVFWRDGQAIVVLRGDIGHKNFWLVDLKSGAERQLTDLPPDFVVRDFDVSSDGSRIVFDRVEESSEIALIDRAG